MENYINKLLNAYGESIELKTDEFTLKHLYQSIGCSFQKKWISNILPYELTKRSIKEAVNSIMTMSEGDKFYSTFPDKILTPDYGDNWGRFANYIEINNRAIGNMDKERCCCGLINTIKLLPAIPPSAKSWANCIILSQIFPNIYGDGYNKGDEENSIYGIKLNCGYSENIISNEIKNKISPEEQIIAFNTLAHFRGIKTGFRTIISEDQLKIACASREENFRWHNDRHVEIYINEMTKLMKLGFEAMFVDSAKHIGGYDMGNYTGVGALPDYKLAQEIFHEIRVKSGKTTICFIGEKSTDDFNRYENMGLNAGTDYITGDDFDKVKELCEQFKYNRNYAPGVEIENDNYGGGITYEQRLKRIKTALFGFNSASDKLPSFMQMNDIFPLRHDTDTHKIMMENRSYSDNSDKHSHIKNLFSGDDGRKYNHSVGELFAHALCL